MNIVSFNVGIELGQVFALAFMLLVIAGFRNSHSFPAFSKISNYFLILAGAFLFLMQMHGYEHAANAQELTGNTEQPTQQNMATESVVEQNWKDSITVIIPAKMGREYKLQLAKDAVLEYAWATDKGELFFDFHGEPKGDTTGYFKSFKEDTKPHDKGSLTTTFEGTHGWYWRNDNPFQVVITVRVAGDYQRLDLNGIKQ
jgi:hypothetical protein